MSEDLGHYALDDAIRGRLAAAAPPTGDADAVLRGLDTRFRHARRRRRIILGGASALIVSTAIVVGILALGAGTTGQRSVRVAPANSATPTVPAPSTPTSSLSESAPTTSTGAPSTSLPGPSPPSATAPNNDSSATATLSFPPVIRTYESAGGSVTVRLEAGAVSLVSSRAAPSFNEERHDAGPDRVEVRFSNGTTEWRIRVDVVNGELVEETTQHG